MPNGDEKRMKKRYRIAACVLALCFCAVAAAETFITDSFVAELFERSSAEELAELCEKIEQELVNRGYICKENYVLNIHTNRFHYSYCKSTDDIKETNRRDRYCTRDELIAMGFTPCGNCQP